MLRETKKNSGTPINHRYLTAKLIITFLNIKKSNDNYAIVIEIVTLQYKILETITK